VNKIYRRTFQTRKYQRPRIVSMTSSDLSVIALSLFICWELRSIAHLVLDQNLTMLFSQCFEAWY
jgi:hypothetical protein